MDFLLTYDAYMSQEKMQEICPSHAEETVRRCGIQSQTKSMAEIVEREKESC
mgnify:CR=1 FL=1